MDDVLSAVFAVATLGVAWVNLLLIRPAVARARLRREATLVQYRVIDAVLDRQVERDDPAVDETLYWIHVLTHHSSDIGWSEAKAIASAVDDMGVVLERPVHSYNNMTPAGRKVMIEAERDLDRLVAEYFVNGSRLWWVLAPSRDFWRWLHRRFDQRTPPGVSPENAAQQARRASTGTSDPVLVTVKGWLNPKEPTSHVAA